MNNDERSVIKENCSDSSMSFNVVSITGWPVVGNDAMECRAWLDSRGLKACVSICDCAVTASIIMHALTGLPVRGFPSCICLGEETRVLASDPLGSH